MPYEPEVRHGLRARRRDRARPPPAGARRSRGGAAGGVRRRRVRRRGKRRDRRFPDRRSADGAEVLRPRKRFARRPFHRAGRMVRRRRLPRVLRPGGAHGVDRKPRRRHGALHALHQGRARRRHHAEEMGLRKRLQGRRPKALPDRPAKGAGVSRQGIPDAAPPPRLAHRLLRKALRTLRLVPVHSPRREGARRGERRVRRFVLIRVEGRRHPARRNPGRHQPRRRRAPARRQGLPSRVRRRGAHARHLPRLLRDAERRAARLVPRARRLRAVRALVDRVHTRRCRPRRRRRAPRTRNTSRSP